MVKYHISLILFFFPPSLSDFVSFLTVTKKCQIGKVNICIPSQVENTSDQNTSQNTSANKNSNIICISEKPDKNVTLKMALSQYSTSLGESSTSNLNESKKLIKPDMKNLVHVNLLGNLKSKGNVKMILCKRSSIDPGASGSSNVKSIENIAADSKMLLSSIKMNPKQEVARLKAINEELVKKVKNLEKLVPINEKLTERVKYLEKLVQDLQIKNKVETKIEEVLLNSIKITLDIF